MKFCLHFWHGSNECSENARAALSLEKRRISQEWQKLKNRANECSCSTISTKAAFSSNSGLQAKLVVVLVIQGMLNRALNWSAVTTENPT